MIELLELRQYNPDLDKNFIYSTWLNTYKTESYFAHKIRRTQFFAGHQKIIDHILNKATSKVLIACLNDEPDVIIGYLVWDNKEDPVLHYVYVKPQFRKLGVMRSLLEKEKINLSQSIFTHWTKGIDKIIDKYSMLIYDPYQL